MSLASCAPLHRKRHLLTRQYDRMGGCPRDMNDESETAHTGGYVCGCACGRGPRSIPLSTSCIRTNNLNQETINAVRCVSMSCALRALTVYAPKGLGCRACPVRDVDTARLTFHKFSIHITVVVSHFIRHLTISYCSFADRLRRIYEITPRGQSSMLLRVRVKNRGGRGPFLRVRFSRFPAH